MEEELVTIDDRSDTMDQTFLAVQVTMSPLIPYIKIKKHNLISGEWENFK